MSITCNKTQFTNKKKKKGELSYQYSLLKQSSRNSCASATLETYPFEREAQCDCSQQTLTRNAARMILVTFSLTDSWRISDSTGTILYRRRYSHIWGLNASSHTQKIIWYWSWKPHLLLKTPMILKNSIHLIFK